ncbi:hypothetical protein SAMN05444163_8058 [Bradyrhizobium ottawaense]|uniref:Uncharacterized protein n=1 Tax=Bradyrhizobium ottawaense TaxID=931866 RepID=A0ABY0QH72_9BRAD|nr:hypothetical protein SAMN05444163_8058 [Bradyrhizobium ottawaense]
MRGLKTFDRLIILAPLLFVILTCLMAHLFS